VTAAQKRAPLRDFRILWTGQVVSSVGTRVSGVAFPLLTLALTHSATAVGIVSFAGALPLLLLTLHAGALVDRHDRKRLMAACEAARALALGSVVAGVHWHFVSVAQLASSRSSKAPASRCSRSRRGRRSSSSSLVHGWPRLRRSTRDASTARSSSGRRLGE
jgi:hypothetical protein